MFCEMRSEDNLCEIMRIVSEGDREGMKRHFGSFHFSGLGMTDIIIQYVSRFVPRRTKTCQW
jgi:hypothetical protein